MTFTNYVIGSGPSGVACASALLGRGGRVVMVDAGISLERDRAAAVESFLSAEANGGSNVAPWLAESDAEARRKIPRKLLFGSTFAFQGAEEHLQIDSRDVGLQPSLATGGLSNVWGAAILPYIQSDIEDWPLEADALGVHRQACLELTGISGARDGLSELLPLDAAASESLGLSAQATALSKSLSRNEQALRGAGILFGRSRLAVQTGAGEGKLGCRYCGMCLSGCPYEIIYSADRSLAEFRRDANFSHEKDIVIESVEEAGDKAIARGYRRSSRELVELIADRLFLAAGVIPTTRILLKSRDLIDRPFIIKDSQYFLLPVLLNSRVADVSAERLHALSQLFIEIRDEAVSPHLVHLQVYSYNRLISAKLRATLGRLATAMPRLVRMAENRLMLLQGYLHSDHSSAITATLRRDGRFELRPAINSETQPMVKRVGKKLLRHTRRLGLTPLLPLLEVGEPGRGFHSGSTFPISANPGPFETDLLGRPFGWKRIHAVDATVLPSIPATTITLSVMANAHRIASNVSIADTANV